MKYLHNYKVITYKVICLITVMIIAGNKNNSGGYANKSRIRLNSHQETKRMKNAIHKCKIKQDIQLEFFGSVNYERLSGENPSPLKVVFTLGKNNYER